eukprot:762864-Hanusia_phi.AAC.1
MNRYGQLGNNSNSSSRVQQLLPHPILSPPPPPPLVSSSCLHPYSSAGALSHHESPAVQDRQHLRGRELVRSCAGVGGRRQSN